MRYIPSIKNRSGPDSPGLERGRNWLVFSGETEGAAVGTNRRVQVQVPLPFGREPKDDERIKKQLALGWRIAQLQRLSDQEVLVTYEVP